MLDKLLKFSKHTTNGSVPISVLSASHAEPINMHSHDYYELVYVREGFTVHYYEDSTTILTEGDLFIVCPGVQHAYTGLHYTDVYNCIFTDDALRDVRERFRHMPGMEWLIEGTLPDGVVMRVRLDTSERMRVLAVIERMKEEQDSRRLGWEIMMETLLVQILTLFSRSYAVHYLSNPAEKAYLSYVLRVLTFIEEHYNEPIDLKTMAAHVDISPDYLSRQFKKIVGLSPAVFLRSYRLARAMDMIRSERSENFGEIAQAVGYKHLSHFSREFKCFTGVTPSEYKVNCYKI